MDKDIKLHVEVHGNKFDGEGPAEIIEKAYKDFLARVEQAPAARKLHDPDNPAAFKASNPPPGAMDALYKRVFVERDGLISLQVLPKGKEFWGDALVLLIHGYQRLKTEEYPVSAVRLMQVAKLSGVNIERLDRALASKSDVIMKAGFKRSTRYSLNNLGEQQAIDIMKNLFS